MQYVELHRVFKNFMSHKEPCVRASLLIVPGKKTLKPLCPPADRDQRVKIDSWHDYHARDLRVVLKNILRGLRHPHDRETMIG